MPITAINRRWSASGVTPVDDTADIIVDNAVSCTARELDSTSHDPPSGSAAVPWLASFWARPYEAKSWRSPFTAAWIA
jgi:hypothetical protein